VYTLTVSVAGIGSTVIAIIAASGAARFASLIIVVLSLIALAFFACSNANCSNADNNQHHEQHYYRLLHSFLTSFPNY
jgi:hypothetical protein